MYSVCVQYMYSLLHASSICRVFAYTGGVDTVTVEVLLLLVSLYIGMGCRQLSGH